jgi:multidrug efflux pump
VLESGILSASLLVMMIIVASLGIRQGLIVGLAIPACFLLAFMMINFKGVTLNQMVMFGMVLAVGILVDGGIVVVEYADRKMAEGLPKEEAFAAAAKRMFWPVVNGTLTTLCAFLPFMFWNSIAGKFMSYLPLTLFFVLGSSIFVALIFTPALGSIFGRKTAIDAEHLAEIEKSEHGDPREMKGFMGWYARSIAYLGRHPLRTVATTLLIIFAVGFWFGHTKHRTLFFLDQDPEQVTIFVKAPRQPIARGPGRLMKQVEGRLVGVKGHSVALRPLGSNSSNGGPNSPPNDTIGRIYVEFQKYEDRKLQGIRGKDIANTIRGRVRISPAWRSRCASRKGGPPTGKAVQGAADQPRPHRARQGRRHRQGKVGHRSAADRA